MENSLLIHHNRDTDEIKFGKIAGTPEHKELKESVLNDLELLSKGVGRFLGEMDKMEKFNNLESCMKPVQDMNKAIQKILRENLEKFEYGCVMLYLDVDDAWWKSIQDEIDDDDIYTETGDRSYGRVGSHDSHVTILYGIHNDVPDEAVDTIINEFSAPKEITLKQLNYFDKDPKFDVLKFDLEGEGLTEMNTALSKLPHTTDYPNYQPHLTVTYLKNGKGKKYGKELSGDKRLKVKSTKLVYSKPDGDKNEYKLN